MRAIANQICKPIKNRNNPYLAFEGSDLGVIAGVVESIMNNEPRSKIT